MLTRDHTDLPVTHKFIQKWNEPYCKALNLAALNVSEFACKFILAPLILANPNCAISPLN